MGRLEVPTRMKDTLPNAACPKLTCQRLFKVGHGVSNNMWPTTAQSLLRELGDSARWIMESYLPRGSKSTPQNARKLCFGPFARPTNSADAMVYQKPAAARTWETWIFEVFRSCSEVVRKRFGSCLESRSDLDNL